VAWRREWRESSPPGDVFLAVCRTARLVVLTAIRGQQDDVVLAIAHLCPWLHLKDAKRIVESPPAAIAVGLAEDEAAVLRLALIEIGATVEVRGAPAT
jgi:ribosomal protein L7/L12